MALVRYNHNNYTPVAFSNFVDKFFNDSFFSPETSAFTPKVDVIESKENFEIRFSIPGVDKADIAINLDKGKLTISGERKMEEKTESRNYRSVENTYGKFTRSFYLPENINEEKIEAAHVNGILSIIVPKEEPKDTSKNIEIK